MNRSLILVVFRKELKEVLRDRKTLVFMLILPTLAIPLLMTGASRFLIRAREKRARQEVVIAASSADWEALKGLLDEHARSLAAGGIGQLLREAAPDRHDALLQKLGETAAEDPDAILRIGAGRLPPELRPEARALTDAVEQHLREGRATPSQRRLLEDFLAVVQLTGPGYTDVVDPGAMAARPAAGRPAGRDRLPESIRSDEEALAFARAITAKRIQAAVVLADGFEERLRGGDASASARVYHDSTIPLSKEAKNRLEAALEVLGRVFLDRRLGERGLDRAFVEPVSVTVADVAPRRKRAQAVLGGILPYIIILFCFLGAFYPAIDLAAGEKERQTLETLLLSPASRFEIASGKFLVILLTSFVAANLGLASMAFTVSRGLFPADLLARLDISFDRIALFMSAVLTLPVASIFASLLLSVSIYARSFKEGQSYAAPLQFLIIVPAMVSLIPDIEISWKLALIPIVNVSLVMREFMKGEYLWGFFGVTIGSTIAIALVAITFAAKWFDREDVIFRS